jgi:hypothetical protein
MILRSFHELECAGFEQLDPELRQAVVDLAVAATRVLVKHNYRSVSGEWRRQRTSQHLKHAVSHCNWAKLAPEFSIDDDGLPQIDHAAARLALYYGRKRLGE